MGALTMMEIKMLSLAAGLEGEGEPSSAGMRTTTSRRARVSHARSGCGKRRGTEVTPGDAQRPTSVQRRA